MNPIHRFLFFFFSFFDNSTNGQIVNFKMGESERKYVRERERKKRRKVNGKGKFFPFLTKNFITSENSDRIQSRRRIMTGKWVMETTWKYCKAPDVTSLTKTWRGYDLKTYRFSFLSLCAFHNDAIYYSRWPFFSFYIIRLVG